MSTLNVAAGAIRRDETVEIVLLLAFAGGYTDAYTWIIDGVMANAQTANVVLLWVYAMAGDLMQELHFAPPILAFTVGIVIAAMQAAMFVKVEGSVCSTVMITGNMRQSVGNIFAVVYGGAPLGTMRKSVIFFALCAVFGCGAAAGAFATKTFPDLALGIPVVADCLLALRSDTA